MGPDKKDPRSVLAWLWITLVLDPWRRVRGVHDDAPAPSRLYRVAWVLLALGGNVAFLVPALELLALYAAIYVVAAGLIRIVDTIRRISAG